jgi:TRAP-type mannitol/chloroaromatic compound transport system permease small subunit
MPRIFSKGAVMQRMIQRLESITELSGKLAAWAVLGLIALVLYDTLARYLFSSGSIALQELEWHIHDVLFLLGISYALKYNAHVRVDLFYEKYSDKLKAWINIIGVVLLIIPFSVFIFYTGMEFARDAYSYGEMSPNPGGLGYRFVIKSVISIAFALVILQAVSELLKSIQLLSEKRQ